MNIKNFNKLRDINFNIKKDIKKKKEKLSDIEKKQLKEEKRKEKLEKKELKQQLKKVLRSNIEVIPFLDINEDNVFITKQGFLEIFQIDSKDIYALSEDEARMHMYFFIKFLRNYIDDLKIVCMNFPVNTLIQQENIIKKINRTEDEIYKRLLNEKLEQLKFLESHRSNKEFFVMIFIENEADIEERIISIMRNQNFAMRLRRVDLEKKIKILFKLYNPNTKIIN
ncbi:hypothetical protein [Clostridium baratii]|uniref:Uncharacterized protein n=1 Tax=Clostridium baratii TaxID=1561 RepID=A0A174V6R2_9CLOT|nr:hypothetical protein [Clostridium baratii]CUQ30222.1 Uncharacterised protein [Clostridium baratii]